MPKITSYANDPAYQLDDAILIDGVKGTRRIHPDDVGPDRGKMANVIYDSASGVMADIPDGANGMVMKSVVAQITPVQEGSGDPAPDNIRPITGWTGCKVTRTGKNILGGIALRDAIKTSISNATINESEGYISYTAGASSNGKIFATFKENTVYTFILTLYKTTGVGTNLTVWYSDGTFEKIPNLSAAATKETVVFSTNPEKSVARLGKSNASGTTQVFYNESGIFEGERTINDLDTYVGETTNIAFPEEVGTVYGGTLDATNGVLTVTDGEIESYNGETLPGKWISDRDVYSAGTTPTIGAQVVYELAEPIVYHLTSAQLTTLLGENHLYASTGDISVEYPCDTKMYIDKKVQAVIATASTV